MDINANYSADSNSGNDKEIGVKENDNNKWKNSDDDGNNDITDKDNDNYEAVDIARLMMVATLVDSGKNVLALK